ncbi:hypothetical protein [Mesorhizobium sp. M8A.F.Ca.ET.165.01.1.1]|uniref:hypothetical protein n=1 Tax=Mesorhizobium sp. M8A.F.Ca.ET.165.01.1.1 TaxID=2563960 RepID=UPI00109357F9|nr:hypothetical protein [Mesorhizobium sp. M8A.F.Ca.ET.165.01.1.1]TGT42768.1 hypothetical protein EN808_12865 [Mesorhizobium sp. M8A.F.Ca.ET.165.01.1.1]
MLASQPVRAYHRRKLVNPKHVKAIKAFSVVGKDVLNPNNITPAADRSRLDMGVELIKAGFPDAGIYLIKNNA